MGWISEYLTYTQEQESPEVFHKWSAIAVLGHAMGRRCWLDRGGLYKIYPGQLMVLLVARSAIAHKSTAINLAVPFLKALPWWAAYRLPAKLSPQQLLQCLEAIAKDEQKTFKKDPFGRLVDSCGFIVASEMGMFFTAEEWARTLPTHICDLNDAEEGKRRFEFRSWKATLWNPCVGMLGGTTPKGLAEELPATARQAGFLGRTILVYSGAGNRPNSLTTKARDYQKIREWLKEDIKRIGHLRGRFQLTKTGAKYFDDWYYGVHYPWMKTMVDTGRESDDTGYYGRKGEHALRVALVLSASAGDSQQVDRYHIERSLAELSRVEKLFSEAVSEVGVGRHADLHKRILDHLDKAPEWIPRWRLTRHILRYGNKKSREEAIDSLVEAKKIQVVERDGVVWYGRKKGRT